MNGIDFLEHGGATSSDPFRITYRGDVFVLADPTCQQYQWVLLALQLKHVPGMPDDIPAWMQPIIFERWRIAWDLPSFNDARRLAYLVDRHRAAIIADLAHFTPGVDLGELWRARRWATLLSVLDRLPGHSHFSASVSMDEEHSKLLAEAIASRPDSDRESAGPALTTWTPEVAMLAKVLDAVNGVRYAVYASQIGKKAGEPPAPEQRPKTPLEGKLKAARFEARRRAHQSLVSRVLASKAE